MKPSSARCAETSSAGLSTVGPQASSRSSHRFLLAPSSLSFLLHWPKPSLVHHPNLLHHHKASLLHRPRPSHPLPPGHARSRSCAAARPRFVYEPMRKPIGMGDSTGYGRSWLPLPVSRRQPAMQRLAGRSTSRGNPRERYGPSYADCRPLAIAQCNQPSSRPPRQFNGSIGFGTASYRPATARTCRPRRSLVQVKNLEGRERRRPCDLAAARMGSIKAARSGVSSRVSRLTQVTAPFLDSTLISARTSRLGLYSNAAHTTSEIGLT
jgi:hypothetical protein